MVVTFKSGEKVRFRSFAKVKYSLGLSIMKHTQEKEWSGTLSIPRSVCVCTDSFRKRKSTAHTLRGSTFTYLLHQEKCDVWSTPALHERKPFSLRLWGPPGGVSTYGSSWFPGWHTCFSSPTAHLQYMRSGSSAYFLISRLAFLPLHLVAGIYLQLCFSSEPPVSHKPASPLETHWPFFSHHFNVGLLFSDRSMPSSPFFKLIKIPEQRIGCMHSALWGLPVLTEIMTFGFIFCFFFSSCLMQL